MKRKLVIAAACLATALMTGGIAQADPEPAPAPGPDPNGPKCDILNGGDNGDKWEHLVPCGWAYGDQKGWYQLPA
jgi:hypothetical protein